MVLCTYEDRLRAEWPQRMSVQRFLHTIDGISTWVGKAAAWLIIALMTVVCVEVFKRYILNAPTAWIFDLDNMLYGSLFMLCGRLYAGAERPCPRRLPLQLDAAAHAGLARSGAVYRLFRARHRRADLRRLRLCRGFLAHRGAFECDRGRPAGLSLQDGHPDCRRAGDAAGHCRNRALRRLPPDRGMAEPAQGRRRDRRHRGAARTQRVRRR